MNSELTVIGAGVAGLTTALRLVEEGYRVTCVAAERSPNTTSDIAAAVWFPYRVGSPDRALKWAAFSYRAFAALAGDAAVTGVSMVPGMELLGTRSDQPPAWSSAVDSVRQVEESALPEGYRSGWAARVPVVEMTKYLRWLAERFTMLGGSFRQARIDSLADSPDLQPIVVNCTGLGAGELARDDQVIPVRGQIVRVAAGYARGFVQAVEHESAAGGPPTYIIPRPDLTVLGGTSDVGQSDLRVQPEVADDILGRCTAICPELAEAPILSHAVGLRPYRPEVRLERERLGGRWIVHNYGHGGAGVTVSWGCAEAAVELVRQIAPT